MRGAADSIGIATTISLKTQPAPEEVCVFIYEFSTVIQSVEKSVSMLMGIQNYMSNATLVDRRLSLSVQTSGNPDPESGNFTRSLLVAGIFIGSLTEFTSRIEPELLRQIPDAPSARDVQSFDWINSLRRQSPDGTLDGKPESLDFFANSVTIDDPGLTEEAVTNYFTHMISGPAPPVSFESSMELWGGADGQINLAAKNTSFAAFPHRNVFWTAHNRAGAAPDAPFPDEGITFLNGLNQAIIDGLHAPTAAYPNLLDTSLTREEAHELYYGDEVLARLQRIKAVYDPRDVFWNPQSI
jgi:FAD/FMN-containing dehydrogenase